MIDEKELAEALGVSEEENGAQGEKDPQAAEAGQSEVKKGEQSPEERHKYAALRRKTEKEKQDAAIRAEYEAKTKAAVEEAEQRGRDQMVKEMALKNPYDNGKVMQNEADFRSYKAEHQRRDAKHTERQLAEKTGVSLDNLKSALGIEDKQKEQEQASEAGKAESAEKARSGKDMDAAMQKELAEISRMAPEYKTLNDIAQGPHGQEFSDLVKRGMTFEEAFKVAYFEEIKKAPAKSAGKDHLRATKSVGGEPGDEPDEATYNVYKMMMPDATDDDIMQMFRDTKKYMRRKG